MSMVVREWIAKAEADYATARREMVTPETRNYDAVCFHAQQCAEKLLKGLLIQSGVTPPKLHDLVELHRLVRAVLLEWSWPVDELRLLTRAAVDFRYPGEDADLPEASAAFDVCTRLRSAILPLFGPPT